MPRNALTDRPPTAAGDTGSVWTQPRFVVAALVLALIAALGIGMALSPDGDPKAAPPTAAGTTEVGAGAVPVPVADPAASVCGLPAGDQKVPAAAPRATRWELVGTMAAPTAPKQLGPGKVTAGLRSCFAHSPTGALYAAVNLLALTTKPELHTAIARELTAAGVGRDAALAALAAQKPTKPNGTIQIAGFSFLNYTPDSTVIDVALRVDTGGLVHLPVTMRWEGRDWKVVVSPSGELTRGMQEVPDLVAYQPWSGA